MAIVSKLVKNENFWFALMGFLVFSSMSSILLIDYLHFPIAMPELFLLPFIFILKNKLTGLKIYASDICRCFIFVGFLILVGILNGEMELWSMLSYGRSWLYILILITAFRRSDSINNDNLMYLSFGSITGWFVASLINFKNIVALSAFTEVNLCTYGTMLAIPVFFSCTMKRGLFKFFAVGLVFVTITMVLASLRRLIAIVFLSIFATIFFLLIKDKKKLSGYIFVALIVFGIFVLFLPFIKEYIASVSPEMYHRTFTRIENMIEFGSTGTDSDDLRKYNITYTIDNIIDYILPRGMIGTPKQGLKIFAPFIDFPMMMLLYLFGAVITFILLCYILNILIRNFRKFCHFSDETSLMSCVSLIVMFALLFIEGTFLYFPYAAPLTGALLGRAIQNSKTNRILL